jgi:muconolactone delta-isomerase
MLYLASLRHDPEKCPGVALEIRDRVVTMVANMKDVLQSHQCAFQHGWVSKSAHMTFLVFDAPHGHAVDDAIVDMGLAVWNTVAIYPVITFDEAVGGLPD